MAQYAKNTNVSSEMSRLEIEKILIKYGASNFAYATAQGQALIAFTMYGRQVRFLLPLPKREEYRYTPTGRERTENSQYDAWEQACRPRRRGQQNRRLLGMASREQSGQGVS